MAGVNVYDQNFEDMTESREQLEQIRSKLIEGMLELSEVKRVYSCKQKEVAEKEIALSKIVESNQELKNSLMKALIQKEELTSKKMSLTNRISNLNQSIDNLESDSNLSLCSDRVASFCKRHSTANQVAILNKIVDAKCKLMEYGWSHSSE